VLLDAASDERRSVLRKVYLYLTIAFAATITLTAVSRLLYRLWLRGLGGITDQATLAQDLAETLPLLLVAAVVWAYHRQQVNRDALLVPELPHQAALRRIYTYLLSAIGLGMLSVGVGGLLKLLLGALTGVNTPADWAQPWWKSQFSLFVTVLLVGISTWLWFWLQVQRRVQGEEAAAERESTIRRIYLYLATGASVIGMVGAITVLIYSALRLALGLHTAPQFLRDLSIYLSTLIAAATVLVYHVRILRAEQAQLRAEARMPVPTAPPSSPAPQSLVVVLSGGNLADARQSIQGLSLSPQTQMHLIESGLSPEEVERRLAPG